MPSLSLAAQPLILEDFSSVPGPISVSTPWQSHTLNCALGTAHPVWTYIPVREQHPHLSWSPSSAPTASLFRCCFRMMWTTSPAPLSRQARSAPSVLSTSFHTDLPLYSLASRTASSGSCLLISMCLDIPLETPQSRSIAAWNHCCNKGTLIKGIPSAVNPNQSCVQTQGWISLACFRGNEKWRSTLQTAPWGVGWVSYWQGLNTFAEYTQNIVILIC